MIYFLLGLLFCVLASFGLFLYDIYMIVSDWKDA